MGIWERLGNVIKSYLSDDDYGTSGEKTSFGRSGSGRSDPGENSRADPDLDAAYEELNDFLRGKDTSRKDTSEKDRDGKAAGEKIRPVPKELREDFAELGLEPEASARECKESYKKLLKMYHPDRHAGNLEAVKMATEKTARVNVAYDRIEKWFRTGDTST